MEVSRLMLEAQVRRTRAIALNNPTTEHMTAYCGAILNLWERQLVVMREGWQAWPEGSFIQSIRDESARPVGRGVGGGAAG